MIDWLIHHSTTFSTGLYCALYSEWGGISDTAYDCYSQKEARARVQNWGVFGRTAETQLPETRQQEQSSPEAACCLLLQLYWECAHILCTVRGERTSIIETNHRWPGNPCLPSPDFGRHWLRLGVWDASLRQRNGVRVPGHNRLKSCSIKLRPHWPCVQMEFGRQRTQFHWGEDRKSWVRPPESIIDSNSGHRRQKAGVWGAAASTMRGKLCLWRLISVSEEISH